MLLVPVRSSLTLPAFFDLWKALIQVKAHTRKDGTQVRAHERNVQSKAERRELVEALAKKMARGADTRHATLASAVGAARHASKANGKAVHVYEHADGGWVATHDARATEGHGEKIVAVKGKARLHREGEASRSLRHLKGPIAEHTTHDPKAKRHSYILGDRSFALGVVPKDHVGIEPASAQFPTGRVHFARELTPEEVKTGQLDYITRRGRARADEDRQASRILLHGADVESTDGEYIAASLDMALEDHGKDAMIEPLEHLKERRPDLAPAIKAWVKKQGWDAPGKASEKAAPAKPATVKPKPAAAAHDLTPEEHDAMREAGAVPLSEMPAIKMEKPGSITKTKFKGQTWTGTLGWMSSAAMDRKLLSKDASVYHRDNSLDSLVSEHPMAGDSQLTPKAFKEHVDAWGAKDGHVVFNNGTVMLASTYQHLRRLHPDATWHQARSVQGDAMPLSAVTLRDHDGRALAVAMPADPRGKNRDLHDLSLRIANSQPAAGKVETPPAAAAKQAEAPRAVEVGAKYTERKVDHIPVKADGKLTHVIKKDGFGSWQVHAVAEESRGRAVKTTEVRDNMPLAEATRYAKAAASGDRATLAEFHKADGGVPLAEMPKHKPIERDRLYSMPGEDEQTWHTDGVIATSAPAENLNMSANGTKMPAPDHWAVAKLTPANTKPVQPVAYKTDEKSHGSGAVVFDNGAMLSHGLYQDLARMHPGATWHQGTSPAMVDGSMHKIEDESKPMLSPDRYRVVDDPRLHHFVLKNAQGKPVALVPAMQADMGDSQAFSDKVAAGHRPQPAAN